MASLGNPGVGVGVGRKAERVSRAGERIAITVITQVTGPPFTRASGREKEAAAGPPS